MTKHRVLWFLLVGLPLLVGLGAALAVLSGSGRLTRELIEQVQIGMSRERVIQTIGCPPGDYSDGWCIQVRRGSGGFWSGYERWMCNDGELFVEFDANGTAIDVAVCNVWHVPPPTFLERVRQWLGL